jgi:hypothetical protein
MAFPHSDFERHSVKDAAERAIRSHAQSEHALDQETREMKGQEHTGVELTGAELAYLKKVAFDRMETIEQKIPVLERSLNEGAASYSRNTEEELRGLKKELSFLRHNLAEKLFQKID